MEETITCNERNRLFDYDVKSPRQLQRSQCRTLRLSWNPLSVLTSNKALIYSLIYYPKAAGHVFYLNIAQREAEGDFLRPVEK
ncbi:hypothetical protein J6590_006287 [Homalodisca vitripennis]|nr:hypothetical protein J6590_006287 [Homalodisca vitripennis]